MRIIYYNRAAKEALLACTSPLFISNTSAAVAAFQYITGEFASQYRFPRDRASDRQGPQIAAEFACLCQDVDIGQDLRRLNGRPEDPAFDAFWEKAQFLLEEYKRVDDRRHDSRSGALFLPFAISTRDLRDRVVAALKEEHTEGLEAAGIKVPSLAWIELQFAPMHTGRFLASNTRVIPDNLLAP